ncbi:hypothetical protein EJ05DRAFT_150997 [Pseudovirgaria hyperparasitica]|uniref:Uncharacterized protein n=1 Tax=Pseudovirgaria hyperparasitica TaxID=470096 RepID=A0A6A6VWT6_9PEZI|nr:uncharacterized protein EJ05DRAFT_150997 [Pseudovirgaria hyperparasitica]KAF2754174.1 hypothetical protein EJ05DRAFT_150997 [Pseudovirgaria hyperparasitica]
MVSWSDGRRNYERSSLCQEQISSYPRPLLDTSRSSIKCPSVATIYVCIFSLYQKTWRTTATIVDRTSAYATKASGISPVIPLYSHKTTLRGPAYCRHGERTSSELCFPENLRSDSYPLTRLPELLHQNGSPIAGPHAFMMPFRK